MNKNTLSDFWNTLSDDVPPITCPACGSPISLGNESSYRLVINPEALSLINGQLASVRQHFRSVDDWIVRYQGSLSRVLDLKQSAFDHAQNLSANGTDIGAAGTVVQGICEAHSRLKLCDVVPKVVSDLEKSVTLPSVEKFVSLFTDPLVTGNILDVLLAQRPVFEWFRSIDLCDSECFSDICPGLNLLSKQVVDPYLSSQASADTSRIEVLWTQLHKMCLLLLGHESERVVSKCNLHCMLGISHKVPYLLQSGAVFGGWKQFGEFVRNNAVLSQLSSSTNLTGKAMKAFLRTSVEDSSLLETLRKYKIGSVLPEGMGLNEAHLKYSELSNLIRYCVSPACAGSPTDIPKGKISRIVQNELVLQDLEEVSKDQLARSRCAWIPKEEPTLSVLLIGGTGSSKSALTQSAIVNMKRTGPNLGFDFVPTSPLDKLLISYYEDHYDGRDFPVATAAGSRSTIGFTLLESANPGKRIHVVVNDVAGEQFERILLEGKPDPVIDGCFRSASQIVFLFDLVFWRQLSVTAVGSEWSSIIAQREKLQKDGRGLVDTQDLFLSVSDKLERSYPKCSPGEKPIKRGLTILLPKCDFFVGEQMFLRGWYEQLQGKYLATVESENGTTWASAWWKAVDSKASGSSARLGKAFEVIQEISQLAEDSIRDLHKTVGTDAESAHNGNLSNLINNSLIVHTRERFEQYRIMPVAAIGSDPTQVPEFDSRTSGHIQAKIVSPLFPEAVFLLPILMNEVGDSVPSGRDISD